MTCNTANMAKSAQRKKKFQGKKRSLVRTFTCTAVTWLPRPDCSTLSADACGLPGFLLLRRVSISLFFISSTHPVRYTERTDVIEQ